MLSKLATLLATYNIPAKDINVPTTTNNIGVAMANIMKILTTVIGSLSIIFIIVGGFWMVISNGDAKRIQQGRQTIQYAVIGLIVAISAYAVVTFLTSKVK